MLQSTSANLNKNMSKLSEEPKSSKGNVDTNEEQSLPISSSSDVRTSDFSNYSSSMPSSSNLNLPKIPTSLPGTYLIK